MKLEGPRVTIRRMVADDVDAMLAWRPFADPLYQPFDFPRTSRSDQLRWFEWRSQDPARRLYTVLNERGQGLDVKPEGKRESWLQRLIPGGA